MSTLLKKKLAAILPGYREDVANLRKNHADKVISQVTVGQAYGGMRGVKGMVCDTSVVTPDKGLLIRNIPIGDLTDKLPEEIFWLLITGDLPNKEELEDIRKSFNENSKLPDYVVKVLKSMPADSHPMTMFNTGILVMQYESVFARRYAEGMNKMDYWEPALEDTINLLGKLVSLGSAVYRIRYHGGNVIDPDPKLDWGANYAKTLGLPDPNGEFTKLCQLYLTLHCDHEGGNASAFTTHVVASTLSDPYYALSAGLNALAGPLHGLANQECLKFVMDMVAKVGETPTDKEIVDFTWSVLNSGRVVPGYGHAVLRCTDPRFTAFVEFGRQYCPKDPIFAMVNNMFRLVPDILKEHGKAASPWPNVDAGSGALLYHYGMTEFQYYTVLFSISRAMGVLAQNVLNRALGIPITRPKSHETKWMKEQAGV
jgi:citrate synthase